VLKHRLAHRIFNRWLHRLIALFVKNGEYLIEVTNEIDGKQHGEVTLDHDSEHGCILARVVKEAFVFFGGRVFEGKAVPRDVPVTVGNKRTIDR